MIQNELHDGICEKRRLATIGTHDLSSIGDGDLIYDARPADQIHFVPIGKPGKIISGKEFYEQLRQEADRERKLKKRNQLSGLHKSVQLNYQQISSVLFRFHKGI